MPRRRNLFPALAAAQPQGPPAAQLARLVMEAGGAPRDESWYRQAQANRKERQEVLLPNPVPIRVVPGDGSNTARDSSGSAAGQRSGRAPA